MHTGPFQSERGHNMKKTLLKKCHKLLANEQRESNRLIMGREMFDKKVPKKDIPMYSIRDKGLLK